MSDSHSERFEPQDVAKNTVPKGSSSGDDPLIGPFGSRKPVSQGGNALNKPSQQQNKYPLVTDPKRVPQVRVDELQRTHTDELQHTRTDELKEDNDRKSSQKNKTVKDPLISSSADQEEYLEELRRINVKKILNEEEKRRRNFQRNISKLALFAYEAEEGSEMLERGENPFLEEVDRLLQEIGGDTKPLSEKSMKI